MRKFILIFICLLYAECSYPQSAYGYLKAGDLIFQDLDCGPLCDAIETVTEGFQGRSFSHVGMVVKLGKELFIIEALSEKVQLSDIESFMKRAPSKDKHLIMRLDDPYQKLIPKAQKYAVSLVGKPYDDRFIMDNDSLYCSELIYDAFKYSGKGESIFLLQPMTYKDPLSREFFPAWVDYYNHLKSEIPEGLPGINPGLMSRSPYLIVVEE